MTATAILLAAGLGTRMKSALPKAAHPIAGRPMLRHLLDSCAGVFDRAAVVAGPGMDALAAAGRAPTRCWSSTTGWAPRTRPCRRRPRSASGDVAVLYADNPLIRPDTLRRLLAARARGGRWCCSPCGRPTPGGMAGW